MPPGIRIFPRPLRASLPRVLEKAPAPLLAHPPKIQAVQLSISSDAASFLPRQPQIFVSEIPPDSIFFGHFPAEIHQFRVVEPGLSVKKWSAPGRPRVRGWHHLSLLRRPARLPQAPEGPEGDGGAERRKDGMVILCRFRY